jgi:competence protein ComEC
MSALACSLQHESEHGTRPGLSAEDPRDAERTILPDMLTSVRTSLALGLLALSCSRPHRAPDGFDAGSSDSTATAAVPSCGAGRHLRVHFYDVGQALAALVDLPDGRHVLVDSGGAPRRGCGDGCASSASHLLERLRVDLHDAPIDLLWITHQHADHIGGAPEVLAAFAVGTYVDNGRDSEKAEVRRAHRAAREHGVPLRAVDPRHIDIPFAASDNVKITPVLPSAWPAACAHDANKCSIGLRIDFCASSVLFAGDAEHDEEAIVDAGGPVTLLQVAHHGSETSTTPGFLARVRPKYAVVSAGKPGEGLNLEYCHPRALVIKRLTSVLGGPGSQSLPAFDGERCANARPSDWTEVPTSPRLWATERDGDIVLTTDGEETFTRVE